MIYYRKIDNKMKTNTTGKNFERFTLKHDDFCFKTFMALAFLLGLTEVGQVGDGEAPWVMKGDVLIFTFRKDLTITVSPETTNPLSVSFDKDFDFHGFEPAMVLLPIQDYLEEKEILNLTNAEI